MVIKVKSGSIEGINNISRAIQDCIKNSKKKLELILKYSYPQIFKFKLINFNVRVDQKGIYFSIDKIPSISIYYRAKKILFNLFYTILRSELNNIGLEVL